MTSPLLDVPFLEQTVLLLARDRKFLREFGGYLRSADFKPRTKDPFGDFRWIVASHALEHYAKYHEPIGDLLITALKKHSKGNGFTDDRRKDLLRYGRKILEKKLRNQRAIAEQIKDFRIAAAMDAGIEELMSLADMGELNPESFRKVAQEAMAADSSTRRSVINYFATLDDRIARRNLTNDDRVPAFFIDPLDMICPGLPRGHVGLIAGPWKRGKSLGLLWICLAYAVQGLKCLWITLEDPQDLVEDRLDAASVKLPIAKLKDKQKTLRRKYRRFLALAKGGIDIFDGTDQTVTVDFVEQLLEEAKDKHIEYDAVFIDYDDEMVSKSKHKDRRFEFAEIYRDLRKLAAVWQKYVWTAAQTTRGSYSKKILTGEDLAEDISKARKVSLALGFGAGEWGDESIYIHVMGSKIGKQFIGCNIMTDKDRMCIYDRQATYEMAKRSSTGEDDYPSEDENV